MDFYKAGDIVVLKSGGPKMTVKRLIGQRMDSWQSKTNEQVLKIQGYKDGDLICVWFENNELKEGIFPHETVQASV